MKTNRHPTIEEISIARVGAAIQRFTPSSDYVASSPEFEALWFWMRVYHLVKRYGLPKIPFLSPLTSAALRSCAHPICVLPEDNSSPQGTVVLTTFLRPLSLLLIHCR